MQIKLDSKKLNIRLRVLYGDVLDYCRGSFFGVRAMDDEVLKLWFEYNNLLSEYDTVYPDLFNDFFDMPYPDPYLAKEDSFYKEGTMIYKPEHFVPLRNEIGRMIEKLKGLKDKKTA